MHFAIVHGERLGMFEIVTLACGHQKRYRRFQEPLKRATCSRCNTPRRQPYVYGPDDLRVEDAV